MSNRLKALAICAAGAMIFSVAVTGPASASLSDAAVIAKKGCKKGKKGAAAAKKGKWKKTTPTPAPIVVPIAPTLRATMTWNTTANLDLYAYLPDGTQGGVTTPPGNPIPSSTFSANDTNGLGPETFTDLLAPTRQFAYAVCVENDNGTDDTIMTITVRKADGTSLTAMNNNTQLDNTSQAVSLDVDAGLPGAYNVPFAPATCGP
jgi:hypothetical protein